MKLKEKEFVEHQSGLLVSQDGEVFIPKSGAHKEHFTYGCTHNCDYKQVRFKGKLYLVHRLVAECYIENPDNKPFIDHINMNRSDNRVENLRWCTHQENMTFEDQDVGKRRVRNTDWEALARKLSKEVIQLDLDDVEVARYPSACEVERVLGYSQGNISECCNGKRKTAYKYKWKYA